MWSVSTQIKMTRRGVDIVKIKGRAGKPAPSGLTMQLSRIARVVSTYRFELFSRSPKGVCERWQIPRSKFQPFQPLTAATSPHLLWRNPRYPPLLTMSNTPLAQGLASGLDSTSASLHLVSFLSPHPLNLHPSLPHR